MMYTWSSVMGPVGGVAGQSVAGREHEGNAGALRLGKFLLQPRALQEANARLRANPLAEARQLLKVVEVVHVLLLAVLAGVEQRGGGPSLEHVGGAQGGKRNQTVGVLVIFEAAPEQALDGLNGKVVVRHLSRGGQQAERSDSHGGWLP